jgi:hypothetical protein
MTPFPYQFSITSAPVYSINICSTQVSSAAICVHLPFDCQFCISISISLCFSENPKIQNPNSFCSRAVFHS